MSLANIFETPKFERDIWSFSNADNHRQIITAIQGFFGVRLNEFPIDPMPEQLDGWLQLHQQMHNDFTSILGIQGADLTDLNFKNQRELDAWTFLHATEHREAAQLLGI